MLVFLRKSKTYSKILSIMGLSAGIILINPESLTQEIIEVQEVRPLPENLDNVPVFNSNSPEMVSQEGILLSTFPREGKKFPQAHLNFVFNGRVDVFTHHISLPPSPDNWRTLYLGVILFNPGVEPVKINILQGASYLGQPDAPFIDLPSFLDNSQGRIYAGPGNRVMNDILRGKRHSGFPASLIIPPGKSQLLMNHPIPVRDLEAPINGRSSLIRLRSNGLVYMASLAMFAPRDNRGEERAPNLKEWEFLLKNYDRVKPRDLIPTAPNQRNGSMIYGRVAGVALGSRWRSRLVDHSGNSNLTIPERGKAFSYGINTLPAGQLGTNQTQSAKMLVRYPDTAYMAHGNYGIEYNLSLPLYNNTKNHQTVILTIQTPIKMNKLMGGGLIFLEPPLSRVLFRGTVRVSYERDRNQRETRYVHLVQRRGQRGEPLVQLELKPGERRVVEVDFVYPPDASPPQVLTVKTLAPEKTK
jgi:hypothetical protein